MVSDACMRACVRACVHVCAATTVGSGGNPLQEFGHGFTESVYSRVTNRYVSTPGVRLLW